MRAGWLALVAAAGVGGCSDPVIQMTLQAPSGDFDASCIASVSVYGLGPTYEQDGVSYKSACVDLPMSQPTLADVQAALHGTVTLAIPDGGLAKIIVLGNASSCEALPNDGPESADLIFYSQADYVGDAIELPMTPNVQCATSSVTVTAVDLVALAATSKCSQSLEPDNPNGATINPGTFSTNPFFPGALFSGGIVYGELASGVATANGARVAVVSGACEAYWAGDNNWDALSCQLATPSVCNPATREVGVIELGVATPTADQSLIAQYGPVTFGLVYQGGGDTGGPVANATVTLDDPSAGAVVYYGLNASAAAGAGALTKLATSDGGGSTGSAGLFGVYTSGLHQITVTGAGVTQKVTIAAQSTDPGTAIIRLK